MGMVNQQDDKYVSNKKTISITNDGQNYSLYIDNKVVLKSSSMKDILDEINRYEEENNLL